VLKWPLLAVLIPVTIVALIALLGWSLPRDHIAARTACIRQPPDAVFAAISDVASGPSWRKTLSKVEMLPAVDGRTRFREFSGSEGITMEIAEVAQPTRMVTRIADPDQPFGGTWTFELTPEDAGTRLTITERGEVYNPIFRALARFVFGHTSTIDDYLRALGSKFGESVEPQPMGM
jgi:uncharacterized protein YndB with AHSA1/START domain